MSQPVQGRGEGTQPGGALPHPWGNLSGSAPAAALAQLPTLHPENQHPPKPSRDSQAPPNLTSLPNVPPSHGRMASLEPQTRPLQFLERTQAALTLGGMLVPLPASRSHLLKPLLKCWPLASSLNCDPASPSPLPVLVPALFRKL